jgi:hypothetical protein
VGKVCRLPVKKPEPISEVQERREFEEACRAAAAPQRKANPDDVAGTGGDDPKGPRAKALGKSSRRKYNRRERLTATFARILHRQARMLYRQGLGRAGFMILIELDQHILKKGGRNPIRLSNKRLSSLRIDRKTKYRQLRLLEQAGVIRIICSLRARTEVDSAWPANHHRKRAGGRRQHWRRPGCSRKTRWLYDRVWKSNCECAERRLLFPSLRPPWRSHAHFPRGDESVGSVRKGIPAGEGPKGIDRLAEGQPLQGVCGRHRGQLPLADGTLSERNRDPVHPCPVSRLSLGRGALSQAHPARGTRDAE